MDGPIRDISSEPRTSEGVNFIVIVSSSHLHSEKQYKLAKFEVVYQKYPCSELMKKGSRRNKSRDGRHSCDQQLASDNRKRDLIFPERVVDDADFHLLEFDDF